MPLSMHKTTKKTLEPADRKATRRSDVKAKLELVPYICIHNTPQLALFTTKSVPSKFGDQIAPTTMPGFFDSPGLRTFVLKNDAGDPLLDEDEELVEKFLGVELAFDKEDPRKNMGTGTLLLTNNRIIFLGARCSFDFDARFIALHAVSRDVESYSKPCLYCQFARDEGFGGDEYGEDQDEGISGEDSSRLVSDEDLVGESQRIAALSVECFFAPSNEDDLLPLFEGLSQVALLNPDPEESGYEHEDSEEDHIYFDHEEAMRKLAHLDSVLIEPEDRSGL